MRNLTFLIGVTTFALAAAIIGFVWLRTPETVPGDPAASTSSRKPKSTLKAFASEAELKEYLAKLMPQKRSGNSNGAFAANSAPQTSESKSLSKDESAPTVSATPGDSDSVTNVQHAGVDEGGIVKVHGRHLVILRRGRLFTVNIGDNELRPVSTVDAFGPDIDPLGTWYDEMLISGGTIAVIGYSYQRGGTEIGLFRIDGDGRLAYRSTWHLRSNDYYSARNYASRLVDGKLVFYTPQFLGYGRPDPTDDFPAVRRWRKGAAETDFRPITAPTRVYRADIEPEPGSGATLHSVTTCDLESEDFECSATSVIGPSGRVFYVSPESVYVWVTDWRRRNAGSANRSMLYRMPLDGSAPSALGVAGSPVDQFSFLEGRDGFLNVFVRAEGAGDGMWKSATAAGDAALLRVPIDSFSDGGDAVPLTNYLPLDAPKGWGLQNRFVGDYLLYGSSGGWDRSQNDRRLYAVRPADGWKGTVELRHSVDRIEALGADAVVVGNSDGDVVFSSVSLADGAKLRSAYVRRNAAQGESRSHGFFYKPDGRDGGILGLPIVDAGRSVYETEYLTGSASVIYLKNESLKLDEIGELRSGRRLRVDDGCRASCVDWYGNARPLFLKGRVFALLGYELVEGRFDDGRIREARRISFAPRG